MGLTCAVFISTDRPLKGLVTLFLGLLIAGVGLNNPAAFPRFTFGNTELLGGAEVQVAQRVLPFFKTGKQLRDRLNQAGSGH